MSPTHTVALFIVFIIIQLEAWPCKDKSTPYNDDGNGNMTYLDRHRLRCNSKGMVRFQLDLKISEIKYEYFCCKLSKNTTQFTLRTRFQFDGRGHVGFLDRHDVNCGSNAIIGGFNLERNSKGHKVRYYVICHKFINVSSLNCYKAATFPFSDKGGDVRSLAKHNVRCRSGYFLNKFILERDNFARRIMYRYSCCKP